VPRCRTTCTYALPPDPPNECAYGECFHEYMFHDRMPTQLAMESLLLYPHVCACVRVGATDTFGAPSQVSRHPPATVTFLSSCPTEVTGPRPQPVHALALDQVLSRTSRERCRSLRLAGVFVELNCRTLPLVVAEMFTGPAILELVTKGASDPHGHRMPPWAVYLASSGSACHAIDLTSQWQPNAPLNY
jgi:hypothetical protein